MKPKGQISIIIYFVLLFLILIIGFMAAMIFGIIDYASDTITPIMSDLGIGGETGANLSYAGEVTFGTLSTILDNVSWLIGIAYVAALIFSIMFALVSSDNPNPFFIGLYFGLMLLLMLGCIIMSNIYEDIYTGTDEIALRLQEQTLLSYMMLHSPVIMVLISMITGIFLFTRQDGQGGGFDV